MNDLNLLDKLAKDTPQDRRAQIGRWLFACLSFAGLISGLGIGISLRSFPTGSLQIFELAVMGIVVASFCFPVTLFTLLDAPLGVRFAGVCGSIACILAAITVGLLGAGTPKFDFDDFAALFLPVIPALIASIAVPFLLARYLLGWQIVLQSWNSRPDRENFTVAGLLVATAVVGFCMRLLSRSTDPASAIAFCAMVGGFGFVFLLPLTYQMFRASQSWIYLFVFGAISCFVGIGVIRFCDSQLKLPSFFMGSPSAFGGMCAVGTTWIGLAFTSMKLLGASLVLSHETEHS